MCDTGLLLLPHLHSEGGVQSTIHVCPQPLVGGIIPDVHREAEAAGLHGVHVWQAEGVGGLQRARTLEISSCTAELSRQAPRQSPMEM